MRTTASAGPIVAAFTRRRWLALALASAAGSAAGEEVLHYRGDADFAPFESLDADGRPVGFQIELLAALAPVLGARIDITLGPWADAESALRAGRVDLIAMVDTPRRRQWALFAPEHATPALALYHRRGHPAPQGLEGLAGLRIALPQGDAMQHTRESFLAGIAARFDEHAGATLALAAVQRGDADIALLPRAYGDRALAQGDAPDVQAGRLVLPLQSYAFAVAPGRQALQGRLQAALARLESDGTLDRLRLRWLSSHRIEAERDALRGGLQLQREWTWGVAAASAAALTLLGTLAWQRGRRVVLERRRRREAEAKLQRAEALLERSFSGNAQPMLLIARADARVLDANAALLKLLGVSAADFIGHSLRTAARHLDVDMLDRLALRLDGGGGLDAAPLQVRRADGSLRDCLVSGELLSVDAAPTVFCVVSDITEQLARDAGMRRGYDELAAELSRERGARTQAEERLQQFTRAMSHDMKAPLNAVHGFIGLLKVRLRSGHVDEALQYSEHIDRAAQRMSAMVGALGRLAQLGSVSLQRQPLAMDLMARETWALLQAAHPARRAVLGMEALPPASGDRELVLQVWQNLLDNAMKYSAERSDAKVRLDSHRDERGTWYRITDNGAGFDMARAPGLFQPFQRMHPASRFEGTGIGLSLVRRIVELHGGEIRLRSAVGVGTVVEFTLDRRPGGGAG